MQESINLDVSPCRGCEYVGENKMDLAWGVNPSGVFKGHVQKSGRRNKLPKKKLPKKIKNQSVCVSCGKIKQYQDALCQQPNIGFEGSGSEPSAGLTVPKFFGE